MHTIIRLALILLFSTAFLSACGGGGDSASPGSSTDDPATPPATASLDWDQGNWDELEWQ